MNGKQQCPNCSAALPADAPAGLCPKCLLSAGLHELAGCHLHVRCPHCQHAMEIVDEDALVEITCPSCDSQFSLLGEQTLDYQHQESTIGRFQLLQQLGVGAFGSVWRARDPDLDRDVAIKIPRKDQLTRAESELFLREARSAAQLRHPHIVQVHEVGRDSDRVYIVSDLVEGVTLADRLTAGRLSFRESAELIKKLAEALAVAHDANIIHRDMKPSNVLLDELGEPHITDFGLAKRDAGEITMTVEGRVLGTPAYMPPEQARGDRQATDARSDVYSLGVILFELLTGEKPFRGSTNMLLHQVIHDEPPKPRRLHSAIPRDLETICLKCLEKAPASRYQSAGALANDLGRFLTNDAIRARPIGAAERARRWVLKNRRVAALAAAVVASLLFGLATTSWQWRIASTNFHDAQAASDRADRHAQESRKRLIDHYVAQGGRQLDDGNAAAAQLWFAEALLIDNDSARKRLHRRRLASLAATTPELQAVLLHEDTVREAVFTADGQRLVTISGRNARVWDTATGKPTSPPLQHREFIWSVAVSPDGRRFLTTSMHKNATSDRKPHRRELRMFDIATGELVFDPLAIEELKPIGWFSPDSERFILSVGYEIQIYDATTGELTCPPIKQKQEAWQVAVSPDLKWLLTMEGVWDFHTGQEVITGLDGPLRDYCSETESFVVVSDDEDDPNPGWFQVWDLRTKRPQHSPIHTETQVRDARFLLHGRRLITTDINHQASLWAKRDDNWSLVEPADDGRTGATLPTLHVAANQMPAVSPDDRFFVTIENDGMRVWDAEDGKLLGERFPGKWRDVQFSPDGRRLLATDVSWPDMVGRAGLFDLASGESWVFRTSPHHHRWAKFGADGTFITHAEDGVLRYWNIRSQAPHYSPVVDLPQGWFATASQDGKLIAVFDGPHDMAIDRGGGEDWGAVRLIDLAAGKLHGEAIELDARGVRGRFSPDSRQLAVLDRYDRLYVVEVATGRVLFKRGGEQFGVLDFAWGRDDSIVGVTLAGPRWSRSKAPHRIEHWSVKSGKQLSEPRALGDYEFVRLAPDGRRYLALKKDGASILASVADGRVDQTLTTIDRRPEAIVFAPHGQRFVTVDRSNIARLHDGRTGKLSAPLIANVDRIRFSPSGDYFIAWSPSDTARVVDASSGAVLTPELPVLEHAVASRRRRDLCLFDADSDSLLVIGAGGFMRWPLVDESRLEQSWLDEARLVSGHRLDSVGGYAPLSPADYREFVSRWNSRPISLDDERTEIASWRRRELAEIEDDLPAVAVNHLDWFISNVGDTPRRRYRRATAHLACENWEHAERDYRWLQSRDARRREVHLGLGAALAGQNRLDEASEQFADAVREGAGVPTDAAPWQLRGAVTAVTQMLDNQPDQAKLWYRRGEYHRRLQEWEKAANDYGQQIRLSGGGYRVWMQRGGCFVRINQLGPALKDFEAAEKQVRPEAWNWPDVLEATQLVRLLQGDVESFGGANRKHQAKLLEHSPRRMIELAVLTPEFSPDYEKCLELLEEWIESGGSNSDEFRVLRAAVFIRNGRPDLGLEILRQLAPTAEGRAFAGVAHLELGDVPAARRALEDSLSLVTAWPRPNATTTRFWQDLARLRILQNEVRRRLDSSRPSTPQNDVPSAKDQKRAGCRETDCARNRLWATVSSVSSTHEPTSNFSRGKK